jgi:hypothetical protein
MLLELLFLALGTSMLLRGDVFARWAARRHEQRSAELRSDGEGAYFEERRSLDAYPPLAKPLLWRILGGLLAAATLGGLFMD